MDLSHQNPAETARKGAVPLVHLVYMANRCTDTHLSDVNMFTPQELAPFQEG